MKRLTNKEHEIMEHFWEHGAMFVRELLEKYPEPRPHFNTLSTMVRILEKNGFVAHKAYGNSFQYYPVVSKAEYGRSAICSMVSSFLGGSYMDAVSAFVKEEKLSVDELEELVEQIRKAGK